ncbi:nuclear transport factor 2 family protein [Azospirillum sp. TSA6c]|uniref:nuclear transport factor 2 family protein n=1 Tax=unclassified Azospirillum TaxID=2630922 RepID=UPI000D65E7B3|nr:nuclear transport factor 2 family protein [Azospirillum sp. TSA6c]
MEPEISSVLSWHRFWTMECRYWFDVDTNGGETAHEFYTEDGVFDIGTPGSRYEGRARIKGFYDGRRSLGRRTTIHSITNFELVHASDREASARCVMSLIGADGHPPQQSQPAILIASSANSYVKGSDGRWYVQARIFEALFTDPAGLPMSRINSALSETSS